MADASELEDRLRRLEESQKALARGVAWLESPKGALNTLRSAEHTRERLFYELVLGAVVVAGLLFFLLVYLS